MDQIKNGQKLRKVDVERLKKEQQESWRQNQRKSVMMVRSLEDTISKCSFSFISASSPLFFTIVFCVCKQERHCKQSLHSRIWTMMTTTTMMMMSGCDIASRTILNYPTINHFIMFLFFFIFSQTQRIDIICVHFIHIFSIYTSIFFASYSFKTT